MRNTLLLLFTLSICYSSNAQLNEGFESGSFPPTGWTTYRGSNNAGVNYDWTSTSIHVNSGNNSAFVRFENSGSLNEDWLVTNMIDLSASVTAELRFFARQDYSTDYGSIYSVRVSTTSQTTGFTIVKSWTETQLTSAPDVFEEKVVDLSDYDGDSVYIAFVLENDNGDSWWIDDLSISNATGCDVPSSPVVSSITDNTADLSWGDVTTASLGYNWVIMNSGDDPDLDTPVDSGTTATGNTSDSSSGLLPSTNYNFYVRANCSISEMSEWSTVVNFLTTPINDKLCDAINLTINNPSSNGAYSNVGSVRETQEPDGSCWDTLSNNTVWFSFTAPPSGEVTITTEFGFGTLTDTQIGLYSVDDCNDMSSLTELFCNEDIDFDNDNFYSEIQATGLTSSIIYYIQVDGYADEVGTFDIGITYNAPPTVLISPIALLQGAMLNPNTGEEMLMRDDLRVLDYIPTTSPYADALTCDASVFTVTGQDAIVDWVYVELRDENNSSNILAAKSALIQRDGDIVDVDGVSALTIFTAPGNYFVSVKHRNHLGIMSNSAIALSGTITSVNFADGSVSTYGTNAQTALGMPVSTIGMWSGDSNGEGIVQYSGGTPEGPTVLSYVLNDPSNFLNLPTFSISGYSDTDIDMDGQTQYAGGNSEMPFILQNVLTNPSNFLNLITWPIEAQLPEIAGKAMRLRTEFENKINKKN